MRLPDSVGHDSDGYSPAIEPADAAGGEKGDDVLGDIFDEFESPEGVGNGSAGKNAPGTGCIFGSMVGPRESGDVGRETQGSSGSRGQIKKSATVGDLKGCSEVSGVRVLNCDLVENALLAEHQGVLGALEISLRNVPLDAMEGSWGGEEIGALVEKRSALERNLTELRGCVGEGSLRLCGLGVDEGSQGLDEVLQTTVVSLDEVRKDLDGWRQAMLNEYRSLTSETQAIEPVDVGTLNDQEVEYVPGKLVCTLKAGPNGGRKKCRGVICGNLVDQSVDPTPWGSYASGADGLLIRTTVKHGVQQGWGITTTDVKTAFLLAPRPKPEGAREVIVVPPKIMVLAGVCNPQERWKVHKALYGFPSSPARWSAHRDSVLKTFQWESDGETLSLRGTPEGNLWKIFKNPKNPREAEVCVGHVLVYVDDVMVIAPETVRKGFLGRLRNEWAVSEPETVTKTGWVRFCGLEFQWKNETQLRIAQPSYTKDLLERHGTVNTRSCPIPKVELPVNPEENVQKEELRAAQGITGELLWLAVKSRPDISFLVSLMSRFLGKNLRWVTKLGTFVLEYLAGSSEKGLVYGPCDMDRGPQGNLPITRHPELIEAYADISFAPQGERSCQGILVFYGGSPVQWEACRQPFCAMSTAEAEILSYCEAMQVVQALEALLTVVHGHDSFEKLLCGDNSSAISILTKPDGPWRTRHLRLRSHGLREKLSSQKGDWKLRHQKGTELIADFLTKPITVPGEWKRFASFVGLEGIETPADSASDDSQGISKVPEKEGSTLGGSLRVAKLGVLMAIMGKLANVDGEAGGSVNVKALLVALMMAFVVCCWELRRSVSPSRLRNWSSEVHQNLDHSFDESNFEGWVEEN